MTRLIIVTKAGAVQVVELPPNFCTAACALFGAFLRGEKPKHCQIDLQGVENAIPILTMNFDEIALMRWENEDVRTRPTGTETENLAGGDDSGDSL